MDRLDLAYPHTYSSSIAIGASALFFFCVARPDRRRTNELSGPSISFSGSSDSIVDPVFWRFVRGYSITLSAMRCVVIFAPSGVRCFDSPDEAIVSLVNILAFRPLVRLVVVRLVILLVDLAVDPAVGLVVELLDVGLAIGLAIGLSAGLAFGLAVTDAEARRDWYFKEFCCSA